MNFIRRLPVLLLLILFWQPGILQAQSKQAAATKGMKLDTGQEIFEAACNGCHGPGGRGQPQSTLGFEPPSTFPDFTDCNGSTREKIFDWKATIHEGGPGRGFSEIMPSWTDALTPEQIDKVMQYLRGRCEESGWPIGELNLPRAIMTEKAFPEDEWLLTSSANANGSGGVEGELVYEKRFGKRNQLEFAAPYSFLQRANKGWVGGIGDLVLGYKRVLVSSMRSGSILSLLGEVAAPTGNKTKDLGSGVTTFGAGAAFGQILPRMSFIQMQTGFDLPTDTAKVSNAFFWRGVVGKTFAQNRGFGRAWTPMTEFIAERDLVTGARTNWDIVPEVQITLNKRQHVRFAAGVRTPLNNTAGRTTQLVFYALWDWFDGGLLEGW